MIKFSNIEKGYKIYKYSENEFLTLKSMQNNTMNFLCSAHSNLFSREGEIINMKEIILSKRIGIEYAEEDKDLLLRFCIDV